MSNISDTKEYHSKYYQDHKESKKEIKKEYQKKYYQNNKKVWIEYAENHKEDRREKDLLNLYGITLLEYSEMFENQNGCCAICGRHQSNFKKVLNVDHQHIKDYEKMKSEDKKKYVRGLLCYRCNYTLGIIESINLNKAIEYLNNFTAYAVGTTA